MHWERPAPAPQQVIPRFVLTKSATSPGSPAAQPSPVAIRYKTIMEMYQKRSSVLPMDPTPVDTGMCIITSSETTTREQAEGLWLPLIRPFSSHDKGAKPSTHSLAPVETLYLPGSPLPPAPAVTEPRWQAPVPLNHMSVATSQPSQAQQCPQKLMDATPGPTTSVPFTPAMPVQPQSNDAWAPVGHFHAPPSFPMHMTPRRYSGEAYLSRSLCRCGQSPDTVCVTSPHAMIAGDSITKSEAQDVLGSPFFMQTVTGGPIPGPAFPGFYWPPQTAQPQCDPRLMIPSNYPVNGMSTVTFPFPQLVNGHGGSLPWAPGAPTRTKSAPKKPKQPKRVRQPPEAGTAPSRLIDKPELPQPSSSSLLSPPTGTVPFTGSPAGVGEPEKEPLASDVPAVCGPPARNTRRKQVGSESTRQSPAGASKGYKCSKCGELKRGP